MTTKKQYTKIDNFTISGVIDDEVLTHFIVCDKNGEKFSAEKFGTAAEALLWLEKKSNDIKLLKL